MKGLLRGDRVSIDRGMAHDDQRKRTLVTSPDIVGGEGKGDKPQTYLYSEKCGRRYAKRPVWRKSMQIIRRIELPNAGFV